MPRKKTKKTKLKLTSKDLQLYLMLGGIAAITQYMFHGRGFYKFTIEKPYPFYTLRDAPYEDEVYMGNLFNFRADNNAKDIYMSYINPLSIHAITNLPMY